jgi:oligopeptide/dipeptide ABC transporter ATP-binding protein
MMEAQIGEPLLQVKRLSVEYFTSEGAAKAVNDVSLELRKGETLGIVGESGSGKTTLGLALMGILPPQARMTGGSITFGPIELTTLPEDKLRAIRGRRIAMIFQDPMTSLNPVKKIGDHFVEYITAHEPKTSREEVLSKTMNVLKGLGISEDRLNDYPHQFSGGMRQRVMIGLALALNPDLIIADEPTTALDVIVEAQILELLKDLKRKYSVSLILITHNMGIIAETADRVAVMYAGRIVEIGPALEVFGRPQHPYTQALLQSIPTVEGERRTLKVIPGFPPLLTQQPPGCSFHPRCPYAFDRCRTEDPPLLPTSAEGKVACHLLTKK